MPLIFAHLSLGCAIGVGLGFVLYFNGSGSNTCIREKLDFLLYSCFQKKKKSVRPYRGEGGAQSVQAHTGEGLKSGES